MRRMKEMADIQAGMSFNGEMPNMYNLVLNADRKLRQTSIDRCRQLVKQHLNLTESEMANLNNRRKELQKASRRQKQKTSRNRER